jgi:SAM-dependent methyltransferase
MSCRICHSKDLVRFLSMRDQPHCNTFLTKDQLSQPEKRYPIDVDFCPVCAHVQLDHVVPPADMFSDHPYVSGTTATLPAHFHRLAASLVEKYAVGPKDLVVDIGSNDGTFLEGFRKAGTRTLGVDPCGRAAKIARAAGIDTRVAFWSTPIAKELAAEQGRAKIITAAGVFFHVEDLDDFVRAVTELLTDDGVFVVQAMYLGDIIERTAFDAIYHEHLSYYCIKPLTVLFERFGMEITVVERLDIHGGSFILHVQRKGRGTVTRSVPDLLAEEKAKGLHDAAAYHEFAARVQRNRDELRAMLTDLKAKGKRIALYAAGARGNTLLNFCDISTDLVDYAAEKNPQKFGLYTPGTRIPVIDESTVKEPPDYYLVTSWNFFDEFRRKETAFLERGGKFILPVPRPRIVGRDDP